MGCGASAVADVDDNNRQARLAEPRKSFFRNSIISSIISKEQQEEEVSDNESVDSAIAVNESTEANENSEPKHLICATDVSIEFLLEMLSQQFGKTIEPTGSWIAERLNNASATEAAGLSAVVRVTFGWEVSEVGVPCSYVIKVPVSREAREQDKGKVLYSMFKRECNSYEWVQNFPKIIAPRIHYIKKHANEASGALIVMEDFSEGGEQGVARDGLPVEIVRDLLKRLALIHAQSKRDGSWNTLILDLPTSHFAAHASKFLEVREFFERHEVEKSRMEAIKKYFTAEYLASTVTESADELGLCRVLVHGQPYAQNVFTKDGAVSGLLDWSACHSGCFGEDLAKAICWNLSMKERAEQTTSLLESYHIHLVRYAGPEMSLSYDVVRRAFARFVPLAMVELLVKVLRSVDDHNVYTNDKLLAETEMHKTSVVSGGIEALSKPSWIEASVITAPSIAEQRRSSREKASLI